ncbi:MAG TPA: hypothetical protein VEW46_15540 [Pyrinomonadaceae bacterium]|nr:hypothetical protein [Pyrinomonadaceae bacterium]
MKTIIALWLLTSCLVSIARAQATTIALKDGKATVNKNFAPRKKADAHFYHLALHKGQTAGIKVDSNSVFLSEENECGVYFELFDGKGKTLFLGDSPTGIDEWEGEIAESGNYKIKVYMSCLEAFSTADLRRKKPRFGYSLNAQIR